MIKIKLLFDDGTVKILKPYSFSDIDDIYRYIKRHPEILHTEVIIDEGKSNDND